MNASIKQRETLKGFVNMSINKAKEVLGFNAFQVSSPKVNVDGSISQALFGVTFDKEGKVDSREIIGALSYSVKEEFAATGKLPERIAITGYKGDVEGEAVYKLHKAGEVEVAVTL